MKKALVLLLLLAVVGAFAFADAPTAGSFHAWDRGVFIPYISYNGGTGSAGWGPPWDALKGVDQEWTFSYDGNNYGFSATSEWGGSDFFGAGAYNWWGTYYKFGSIAKITLGEQRITDYSVFSPIEGNGMNGQNTISTGGGGNGFALLQLTPVAGLNIGGVLYVPDSTVQSSSTTPVAAYSTSASAFNNAVAGLAANTGDNFALAVQYAAPNLATFNVFYKEVQALGPTTSTSTFKALTVNATVTAIQNVSLVVDYNAVLTDSSNLVSYAFAGGSTTMGPISAALEAALAMDTKVTSFAVQGNVAYTVSGPYAVGAQVGYDDGKGVNWMDWGTGDWAGVEIYPYVQANYDNGSRIRAGLIYATGAGNGTSPSTVIVPSANEQDATIAFAIDYIWAF